MTAQAKTKKNHWKEFFNYDYLGSHSLEEGEEKILTITRHNQEEVTGDGGKKEKCLVVYFKEEEKGMVMNATNSKTISGLYGSPYVQDWVGKRIQIYAKTVKAFGKTVPALRIRETIPPNSSEQAKKIIYNKIRTALATYKGDDREDIRDLLNKKKAAKEDNEQFLYNILNQLNNA